jgi:hypothetical protein
MKPRGKTPVIVYVPEKDYGGPNVIHLFHGDQALDSFMRWIEAAKQELFQDEQALSDDAEFLRRFRLNARRKKRVRAVS